MLFSNVFIFSFVELGNITLFGKKNPYRYLETLRWRHHPELLRWVLNPECQFKRQTPELWQRPEEEASDKWRQNWSDASTAKEYLNAPSAGRDKRQKSP